MVGWSHNIQSPRHTEPVLIRTEVRSYRIHKAGRRGYGPSSIVTDVRRRTKALNSADSVPALWDPMLPGKGPLTRTSIETQIPRQGIKSLVGDRLRFHVDDGHATRA